MPTDTQLDRDLDSRVFRLGETLRTKAMVYPLEAPPTVDSIREGERLMSQPACTSDACSSGRKPCPTPTACRLPADPEEVHRGPLAWILAGFVLGVLGDVMPKTTSGRVLLAVLAVPALIHLSPWRT